MPDIGDAHAGGASELEHEAGIELGVCVPQHGRTSRLTSYYEEPASSDQDKARCMCLRMILKVSTKVLAPSEGAGRSIAKLVLARDPIVQVLFV